MDPFKAYDIRGIYPEQLNEDLAWRIGQATAIHCRLAGQRFTVGRDMRLSSPALKTALIRGLVEAGVQVVDVGMVTTPALTFAMHHLETAGGAQVTASHNPGIYGGIKLTGPGFVPIGADSGLAQIEQVARTLTPVKVAGGSVSEVLVWADYARHLAKLWSPQRPLRVVVDGGNGMIGTLCQHLLPQLPGLTLIPLLFEPDGRFPVHEANPLKPENLKLLSARMVAEKADFGAAFDGDGDRCALVEGDGRLVPCDFITAILAQDHLAREPGAAIGYDLRSSKIVPEMIKTWGGRPFETKVGHSLIKAAMKTEHAALAGELSGHYYFRDFFGADGGMYAFLLLANAISRVPSLTTLVAPLRRYHQSGELNFKVADASAVFARLRALPGAQVSELDGVTVRFPDWWANVRASNTEPVVRLNLEADTAALLEDRLKLVQGLIR